MADVADIPRASRDTNKSGGAPAHTEGGAREARAPEGSTRISTAAGGKISIKPTDGFRPDDSYAVGVELQNMIKEANEALFLNADNEAVASQLQLQIQKLQKIFGLIEQNRGNAIGFTFKLIDFYSQIFGLQTIGR